MAATSCANFESPKRRSLSFFRQIVAANEVRTHHTKRGNTMDIKRVGTQASTKGPADWFTGTVRIDPLFQAPDPAFVAGASVTFEPGARTAWHTHPLGQTLIVTSGSFAVKMRPRSTHPLGQTLIVTSGVGRVQRLGGPVEEIRPGDVVWFEPEEKHWHGASPTVAMTHIAIQEALEGKVADWMEKVGEEQ